MRKIFLKLLLAIAGIFVYVILINIISYSMSVSLPSTGYASNRYDSGDVVIGLGDSVEVTVTRNRWYGTILENNKQNAESRTLYLLNFISIPLYSNGKSLFFANLILLVSLLIFLYTSMKWIKKRDMENFGNWGTFSPKSPMDISKRSRIINRNIHSERRF